MLSAFVVSLQARGCLTFNAGSSKGPHRAIVLLASFLNCGSAEITRFGLVCNAAPIEPKIPCLLSRTAHEAEAAKITVDKTLIFMLDCNVEMRKIEKQVQEEMLSLDSIYAYIQHDSRYVAASQPRLQGKRSQIFNKSQARTMRHRSLAN